jgi:hypothetical protein
VTTLRGGGGYVPRPDRADARQPPLARGLAGGHGHHRGRRASYTSNPVIPHSLQKRLVPTLDLGICWNVISAWFLVCFLLSAFSLFSDQLRWMPAKGRSRLLLKRELLCFLVSLYFLVSQVFAFSNSTCAATPWGAPPPTRHSWRR